MRTTTMITAVIALALASTACGDGTPKVPVSEGSVAILASCPGDAIGNLNITFGQTDKTYLVGRSRNKAVKDGVDSFDNTYGVRDEDGNTQIDVTVRPVRGKCEASITDYETGEVLWQSDLTAGKSTGNAIVTYSRD